MMIMMMTPIGPILTSLVLALQNAPKMQRCHFKSTAFKNGRQAEQRFHPNKRDAFMRRSIFLRNEDDTIKRIEVVVQKMITFFTCKGCPQN